MSIPDIVDNNKILSVRLRGLNVSSINNIWLNDAESVIFGDKSLDYLIYRNGAHIYDEHRSKTCMTYNDASTKFANGNLIFYIDTYFCITSSQIVVGTSDTTFNAIIKDTKIWEFDIIGIDHTLGILIGKLDLSGTANIYFNGDQNLALSGVSTTDTYNMNPSVDSPFIDPTSLSISETIYILNQSIYDSQVLNVGILINNNYKADNYNKSSLESILVTYRPNTKTESGKEFYDGGSFVITSKGKIAGLITQKLGADNSTDKNISIAVSSNLVSSVIQKYLQKNANGITFNPDEPVLNSFLGISYYPLTPASKSINTVNLASFIKSYGKLGGLVIDGFAQYYNSTNFREINYTATKGSDVEINTPLKNGSSPSIYNYFNSSAKPIITGISFYSTLEKKSIFLELGTYSTQNSLSRFIYEYGEDSNSLFQDIGIEYYYISGSTYIKSNETVHSMKTIYQSSTINNGINIYIPNIKLANNRFNANNLDFSTYDTVLNANEQWPSSGNDTIIYSQINNTTKAIIYIYSNVSGSIYLNGSVVANYTNVGNNQRFEFNIPTSGSFTLYYKNSSVGQSTFRMETLLVDNSAVKIQQNTQLPNVLAADENMGQYRYNLDPTTNYINSQNYGV